MWKQIEPFFGYKLGSAITKQDCRDYTAKRRREGKSNSTIRTELELLRALLRWHYGKEAPPIVAPPPSKARETYLTKDQAETLLASIEAPHIKLFVELALGTGARMGAILDLTWDRVDLTHGTIDYNPGGRDPTNKRRTVVGITPRLRERLLEAKAARLTDYVIEYGGNQVASVKKAVRSAAERSGVPASPHDTDHVPALRPLLAPVHGGCNRCARLVSGSTVPTEPFGFGWQKHLFLEWWALRDLNPRHSRCKRKATLQTWHFLSILQGVLDTL
jgi:integrase